MKSGRRALFLLLLLTGFAAAGTAGTAAALPDNLADCLRTASSDSRVLPGCDDFLAVLHASTPMTERGTVDKVPARTPRPLARPLETAPPRMLATVQSAARPILPVARPQPPCLRDASYFLQGKERLSRSGGLYYAVEAENRDARVAFAVPPHCRIESPLAGEVVFAGTFAGYGGTVILLDKAGNHIVLAGFEELQVSRGEKIGRGTTLGSAGARKPEALTSMFTTEADALLYLEIRSHKGKADPVEFLAGNF